LPVEAEPAHAPVVLRLGFPGRRSLLPERREIRGRAPLARAGVERGTAAHFAGNEVEVGLAQVRAAGRPAAAEEAEAAAERVIVFAAHEGLAERGVALERVSGGSDAGEVERLLRGRAEVRRHAGDVGVVAEAELAVHGAARLRLVLAVA